MNEKINTDRFSTMKGEVLRMSIMSEEQKIIDLENENSFLKDVLREKQKEYISKDKIREKIKKAKEINWHIPKLVIEYFEELLEEN